MGCSATEKDFNFWMPLGVIKSSKEGEMRIGGVASDENGEDLQGEQVLVEGLDVSYLLQRGNFNWDHRKGPDNILGEIDLAEKQQGKLYVEGFLYPNVDQAVSVYKLMKGMAESKSKRKLGLSLEGKVKERDTVNGKQIKKAWLRAVALTYNPINQNTFVDLIKSLGQFEFTPCRGDCSKCTFCEEVEKAQDKIIVDPPVPFSPIDEVEIAEKAISAGYALPTEGMGGGGALRSEDLEGEVKVTTFDEKELGLKKKKKKFTKSELVDWLKNNRYNRDEKLSKMMSDLVFEVIELEKGKYFSVDRADDCVWLNDLRGKKRITHMTTDQAREVGKYLTEISKSRGKDIRPRKKRRSPQRFNLKRKKLRHFYRIFEPVFVPEKGFNRNF